ncbi:hypothetical protein [Pontivivens ytuae]|uniref:Uncharacterized protein n=1 Tax=Pontivivens ytuae TaxID=2789856 RepID=A0A7S9QCN0_9RHOB|nr:hypothetical protein [Pontivivens ytuae]QPH53271.1 hypothetical protein I0K15_15975 [Pontivivens ytuae]
MHTEDIRTGAPSPIGDDPSVITPALRAWVGGQHPRPSPQAEPRQSDLSFVAGLSATPQTRSATNSRLQRAEPVWIIIQGDADIDAVIARLVAIPDVEIAGSEHALGGVFRVPALVAESARAAVLWVPLVLAIEVRDDALDDAQNVWQRSSRTGCVSAADGRIPPRDITSFPDPDDVPKAVKRRVAPRSKSKADHTPFAVNYRMLEAAYDAALRSGTDNAAPCGR